MDAEGKTIGRSGLERRVAQSLKDRGIEFDYEARKYKWRDEFRNAQCEKCGSRDVIQERSYTPDFFLRNGVVVEVKGRLTRRDRKVLLGVRKNNPDLDLRLVFDKDNRIGKDAKSRYSDWAERYGFKWSLDGWIPNEWT